MSTRDENPKYGFAWVQHTNGTYSIRDLENDQAMHSRIGPWEEANRVYAEPSRPEEFVLRNKRVLIHDVGMGTGANAIAAIERMKLISDQSIPYELEVHSFELKPDGVKFALKADALKLPFLNEEYKERLSELLNSGRVQFSIGAVRVTWVLHLGDFFENLSSTPPPDFIYYDFYSPKVVPELWNEESFLKIIKHQGSHPLQLFTYSAATPTRLHMLLAGLYVGEGRSTGIKTETTIASNTLALLENPLSLEWLKKLDTSSSIQNHPGKKRVLEHPQFNPR